MASSKHEYFILLNDMQAKASHFSVFNLYRIAMRNLLGIQNADCVMKGELLVKEALPQDGNHQSHAIYSVALNTFWKVSCSNSDVAPLSEVDYEWLAAIKVTIDRWQVYSQRDKLNAVKALQVGDNVWVSLPVGDGTPHHLPSTSCCFATVQYIGPLQGTPGRWIGVELKVRQKVHYQCK